jgi:HlyD family secretion protein
MNGPRFPFPRPALRQALYALAVALLLCPCISCRKPAVTTAESEFTVKRSTLDITIVETGSLEAAESIDIVSEVPQTLKILEIVEEGTVISAEDVKNGKALIKLDASTLTDQLYQLESDQESTRASFTEATEQLTIQKSENESNIRAAELNVTYARNDLYRLVGDALAERVLKDKATDIATLLDDKQLGGQTKEDLRRLQSDIELARIKLNRAEEKLKYTRKLFEKQFVSKNELDTDELDVTTQQMSLVSAEEKLQIFRRYDFVRDFQKTWASQLEAQEKKVRAEAVARSRQAQTEAQLKSRDGAFERAKQRLEEHKRNIEKCTIKATQPGFVIYQAPQHWENKGPIRAGVEVRPQQTLIRLPDLSRMAVIVKVHEAQVDGVTEKQAASVRVDAMPGKTFAGDVDKKAVIPSSQSRWLNPDLKVYDVKVIMREKDDTLRPGMTATVEILSERLENVLQVPIQSVQTDDEGKHAVFRRDGSKVPVKIGKRNRIFIVVEEGLKEGDVICMNPPALQDTTAAGPAAPATPTTPAKKE